MMSTISQIRERLEAKAGSDIGTRQYWDCIAALLDIAEAAQQQRIANIHVLEGWGKFTSDELFAAHSRLTLALRKLDASANPQVCSEDAL